MIGRVIASTIAFLSGSDRRFLRFFTSLSTSTSEKSSARLLLDDEVVVVDVKDSEEMLNPDDERRESVEISLRPEDERESFEFNSRNFGV